MRTCIIHITAHQAVMNQLINGPVFTSAKLESMDPVPVYPGAQPVMSGLWDNIDLQAIWGVLEELAINPYPKPFWADHGPAETGDGVMSGYFVGADGRLKHVPSHPDGTGFAVCYDSKTLEPTKRSLTEVEEFQYLARLAESELFVTSPWFS